MEDRVDRLRLSDPGQWRLAQVVPFGVFMALLLILQLFAALFQLETPSAPWWRRSPEQWAYPLQVLLCLPMLARWWSYYEFRWSWKWSAIGVVFGAVGIGFWLLPTTLYDRMGMTGEAEGVWAWLGFASRREGFNPAELAAEGSGLWWSALVMRFIRAVVVVALVEEIFWRSFIMRFALDWEGDYWKQPFGKPSWLTYGIVTGLFVFAHGPLDRPAAVIYGSLTYLLCIWSRNLGACVVMHAVANLLMGLYIMAYGKFGLW